MFVPLVWRLPVALPHFFSPPETSMGYHLFIATNKNQSLCLYQLLYRHLLVNCNKHKSYWNYKTMEDKRQPTIHIYRQNKAGGDRQLPNDQLCFWGGKALYKRNTSCQKIFISLSDFGTIWNRSDLLGCSCHSFVWHGHDSFQWKDKCPGDTANIPLRYMCDNETENMSLHLLDFYSFLNF